VDDSHNTSRLGLDGVTPVVAVYTSVLPNGIQAQSLAVSTDRGHTWSRHSGGPVLNRNSAGFRDPKVFRHTAADGSSRWVMVAVEAHYPAILIYSSPDLRDWTYESLITPHGAEGLVWECPDLFPLTVDGNSGDIAWVLLASTNPRAGEDDGQGSAMNYVLGDFDGHTFTPDAPGRWRRLDHGRDFYAGVTFSGMPGERRVMMGWLSNWQYAASVPTAPFRGAMSLPRDLSLCSRDGVVELCQRVSPEVEASWPTSEVAIAGALAPGQMRAIECGIHAVLDVAWKPGDSQTLELDIRAGGNSRAVVTYDTTLEELTFRREEDAALPPSFASSNSMSVALVDGALRVRVVLDAHLVEIFSSDGAAVMSHQVFAPSDPWVVTARGTHGESLLNVTMRRG
ncbi:MAG: glycosyl hydrolase family 32, partial [Actinobacteria bacterium HGW-Actinobacteria-8]